LLALVLWQNREPIHEVLGRQLDLRLFTLAFLITQVSIFITFLRWHILVRVIDPTIALRSSILLGLIGYFFNLVIPGSVGGDVIKAAYLARNRTQKAALIASMAVDRILGLLGLVALAAWAGVLTWTTAPPIVRGLIAAVWGASGLGIIGLGALFRVVPPGRLSELQSSHGLGLSRIMAELQAALMNFRLRRDVLLTGVGLSVISHGLNVVVFYVIGKVLFSARMVTTIGQHFLMAPLTFFTMAVPLPMGALGLTEEVGGQLFSLVGHPSGAMTMMGMRILVLACALEGAYAYFIYLREMRACDAVARCSADARKPTRADSWRHALSPAAGSENGLNASP
jgi:uncharacterized membrane protein YbhN (UPF0104 family)